MIITGTLSSKEPSQQSIFQGTEHPSIRCVVLDVSNPERHFECRILDITELSIRIGAPIQLEVVKVVT